MKNAQKSLFVIGILAILIPSVSAANGYGTSSISLQPSSISASVGSVSHANYTVNLATGDTWGTTLSIVNQTQLAGKGLTLSLSAPNGDPPYSGTITINIGESTQPGSYTAVLQATGDDPSTSDAYLTINVNQPGSAQNTTSSTGSSTVNSTSSTGIITTHNSSSTAYPATGTSSPYGSSSSSMPIIIIAVAVLALLVIAYLIAVMKPLTTRLVLIGTALIVIGTAVWLYGDFNGGIMSYILAGATVIILGLVVWIAGDYMAGAFRNGKIMKSMSTNMIILGVVLILIGTAAWLYGDYNGGISSYIWGGVAGIVVGTLVWLLGDKMAGAFMMRKKQIGR